MNFIRTGLAVLAVCLGNAIALPQKTSVEMIINVKGTDRRVVIELNEVAAPQTCRNFRDLCGKGFYNGISFHRVIPNYIVQAGDPLTKDLSKKASWGTGGPGYTLRPEFGQPHLRGSIAMARLGDSVNPERLSNGSQFYVSLDRIESLDGEYIVFGKVVSGFEHLIEIGNVATDQSSHPIDRIQIQSTKVVGKETAITSAAPPAPAAPPSNTGSRKLAELAPAPTYRAPEPVAPAAIEQIPQYDSLPQTTIASSPPSKPATPPPSAPVSSSFITGGGASNPSDQPPSLGEPPKKNGFFSRFLRKYW